MELKVVYFILGFDSLVGSSLCGLTELHSTGRKEFDVALASPGCQVL